MRKRAAPAAMGLVVSLAAAIQAITFVLAVTVTGDRFCRATDKTYRLDTASARSFLQDFVTLP